MKKEIRITEYFRDAETDREYKSYFCSVGEALSVVILGCLLDSKMLLDVLRLGEN